MYIYIYIYIQTHAYIYIYICIYLVLARAFEKRSELKRSYSLHVIITIRSVTINIIA